MTFYEIAFCIGTVDDRQARRKSKKKNVFLFKNNTKLNASDFLLKRNGKFYFINEMFKKEKQKSTYSRKN